LDIDLEGGEAVLRVRVGLQNEIIDTKIWVLSMMIEKECEGEKTFGGNGSLY
jgi:hypothetical protein